MIILTIVIMIAMMKSDYILHQERKLLLNYILPRCRGLGPKNNVTCVIVVIKLDAIFKRH